MMRWEYFSVRRMPRKHVSLFVSQQGGCVKSDLAPDPCQTAEHNIISLLGHFTTILFFKLFRAQLEGGVQLSHCNVKEAQTGQMWPVGL